MAPTDVDSGPTLVSAAVHRIAFLKAWVNHAPGFTKHDITYRLPNPKVWSFLRDPDHPTVWNHPWHNVWPRHSTVGR